MERDAAKKKEMLEKAAAAPPTPPTPLPSEASMRKQSETPAVPATDAQLDSAEKRDEVQRVSQPPEATEAADQKNPETGIPTNVHQDAPQKSIEVRASETLELFLETLFADQETVSWAAGHSKASVHPNSGGRHRPRQVYSKRPAIRAAG